MDLATMRSRVRNTVKDLDPAAYVWTDGEIDHAIARALSEYSLAANRLGSKLFSGDGSARSFDVSGEAGFQVVAAVEHPVDEPERAWLPFEELVRGQARVRGDAPAAGASNVRVWYSRSYDPADVAWAVPAEDLEAIERGAAAYLLEAGARFYATRIAPSQGTAGSMAALAASWAADFKARLAIVAARPLGVGRLGPSWKGEV